DQIRLDEMSGGTVPPSLCPPGLPEAVGLVGYARDACPDAVKRVPSAGAIIARNGAGVDAICGRIIRLPMLMRRLSRPLTCAAACTVAAAAALFTEAGSGAAAQQPPTFTGEVAPLVYDACATCHRPTGSAPFSLLAYDDVRSRIDAIVAATASR